jgi:hypothetical protein
MTPTAVPTATHDVALVVNVTAVAPRTGKKLTPTPTATAFVAPRGPYIRLLPSSGPPASREVRLIGGNFPKRSPIDMVWSVGIKLSPMDTQIYTGPRGNINVSYTIPASPPGSYRLTAKVNGVAYASTRYRIISKARLAATVHPASSTRSLVVTGTGFVPKFALAIVAYHAVGHRKPIVLGMAHPGPSGRFTFGSTIKRLPPGQYLLRAWSVSQMAAQMAETSFEVSE